MSRASLVLALFMLPELAFGQTKFSINSPATAQRASAMPAGQTMPTGGHQGRPAPAPSKIITLDDAIVLALANSPTIKGIRTQIQQSQAQEITANLRPNPVLSGDSQFLPLFSPGQLSNDVEQYDVGLGYTFERGGKRHKRLLAARDQTAVTSSQVADAERTLTFNVAQQFINALLAQSNLEFAEDGLKSFQQTVDISAQRYKAGDISEGDYLKIKLQLLQFQTDVSSARVAKVQALGSLRVLIGYATLPQDFDVAGDLAYQPLTARLDDLEARALAERPDLRAAQQGIKAARSQVELARANGKQDVTLTTNYSHTPGLNSASWFLSIPLPIFDRNQGEIARTRFALSQAELNEKANEDTVMTDVTNAYESARTNQEVVQLYTSGYLKQAQDSRDISAYAYKGGAATLLDFLDAERSYRATQLAYRQALAAYMLSLEQLRQAVGSRSLP
ncbi:MAG TPA: TolC family protein [Candidatus Limnocylindrales bacterium]|nr:TolC family protein [Candidatus Limnocylindrales bacterium]